MTNPEHSAELVRLRRHLIERHGYTDAYFDEEHLHGRIGDDLGALRWLHAPHLKAREYPNGCERI
jgi:hypothetical protein